MRNLLAIAIVASLIAGAAAASATTDGGAKKLKKKKKAQAVDLVLPDICTSTAGEGCGCSAGGQAPVVKKAPQVRHGGKVLTVVPHVKHEGKVLTVVPLVKHGGEVLTVVPHVKHEGKVIVSTDGEAKSNRVYRVKAGTGGCGCAAGAAPVECESECQVVVGPDSKKKFTGKYTTGGSAAVILDGSSPVVQRMRARIGGEAGKAKPKIFTMSGDSAGRWVTVGGCSGSECCGDDDCCGDSNCDCEEDDEDCCGQCCAGEEFNVAHSFAVRAGDGECKTVTVVIKDGKMTVNGQEIDVGEHGLGKVVRGALGAHGPGAFAFTCDEDDEEDLDARYVFRARGRQTAPHRVMRFNRGDLKLDEHIHEHIQEKLEETLEGLELGERLSSNVLLHLEGLEDLEGIEGIEALHVLEDLEIDSLIGDEIDLTVDQNYEELVKERARAEDDILELIQELRAEVRELRAEVKELKKQVRKGGARGGVRLF